MNTIYIYLTIAVAAALLVPYLLGAPWTLFDYIVAGILIGIVGIISNITTRKVADQKKKIMVWLGIIAVGLYVWAELAVGVFTNLGS